MELSHHWLLPQPCHAALEPDPKHAAAEEVQIERDHHVVRSPHKMKAALYSQHIHTPAQQ